MQSENYCSLYLLLFISILYSSLSIYLSGQICVDFCEIEGSTSEEVEMIDRLFEQQIRSIAVIEDISGYISSIVRSLVIPELRKKEIALNKAKQILAILKGG